MTTPALAQPGYALHRRAYRETSYLVDFLTPEFGRISAVVRGARGRKHKPIEPFTLFSLSWRGRGQLVTVTAYEVIRAHRPAGQRLYAGLYLNELLVRTLRAEESIEGLFETYETALAALSNGADIEPTLRVLERDLLKELGYELVFDYEIGTGAAVEEDGLYRLADGFGFESSSVADPKALPGRLLLAIARNDYADLATRRAAKSILREALKPLLGDKPLASRQLFKHRLTSGG